MDFTILSMLWWLWQDTAYCQCKKKKKLTATNTCFKLSCFLIAMTTMVIKGDLTVIISSISYHYLSPIYHVLRLAVTKTGFKWSCFLAAVMVIKGYLTVMISSNFVSYHCLSPNCHVLWHVSCHKDRFQMILFSDCGDGYKRLSYCYHLF